MFPSLSRSFHAREMRFGRVRTLVRFVWISASIMIGQALVSPLNLATHLSGPRRLAFPRLFKHFELGQVLPLHSNR